MTDNGKPHGYLQLRTFEIDEARAALRSATQIILEAEQSYAEAVNAAADAQAVFRRDLGEAFKHYRKDGMGVQEAEIAARAQVAVHEHDRDVSAGMVKVKADELEDARDTRRSLWRVVEWSARATTSPPARVVDDERAPADWPR